MICKQKPSNPSKYYKVTNSNAVHFLMLKGIYPLYSDDECFYFVKSEEVRKYFAEYLQQHDGCIKS